jgi:hypothetical protein
MRFAVRALVACFAVAATAGYARAEILPSMPSTGEALVCVAFLIAVYTIPLLFLLAISFAVKKQAPRPRWRRRRKPSPDSETVDDRT